MKLPSFKKLIGLSVLFAVYPFVASGIAELMILKHPAIYDAIVRTMGWESAEILFDVFTSLPTFVVSETLAFTFAALTLKQLAKGQNEPYRWVWVILAGLTGALSLFYAVGLLYRIAT